MLFKIIAILGFLSAFCFLIVPLVCIIIVSIRDRKKDPEGFKQAGLLVMIIVTAILAAIIYP